ncbi:MAG: nitroreductase family protein [Lachnospiraceae bacterium]|nr:nitroreductase family protein [Lachnospiraceae bacterium]
MEFKDVIKNRYSCKKYSDRQVENEKLAAILAAGRLAPTAKNLQEHHIYVIQSPEGLAKVDSVTPCRYGAPTVLAVAFDKNNVFTYPGGKRDSGVEDASIVATHLMLAAADEGVDSCWLNFLDPDKAAEALGLPENEEILMFLDLGYAAEGAGALPNHGNRKALAETVSYL